jgi:hypothetical protein
MADGRRVVTLNWIKSLTLRLTQRCLAQDSRRTEAVAPKVLSQGRKTRFPRGGCDETLELEPTPKVIVTTPKVIVKFEDSTARCSLPAILSIHPWSVLVVMRNVLRVLLGDCKYGRTTSKGRYLGRLENETKYSRCLCICWFGKSLGRGHRDPQRA